MESVTYNTSVQLTKSLANICCQGLLRPMKIILIINPFSDPMVERRLFLPFVAAAEEKSSSTILSLSYSQPHSLRNALVENSNHF